MDPKLEQVFDEQGNPSWNLVYDGSIPGAEISIQPWGYGVGISVNGKYLCAIDLYHMSEEGKDDEANGCSQVIIDPEDGGDSLAVIRRFPDGSTEEYHEGGVFLKRIEHGLAIYGWDAP